MPTYRRYGQKAIDHKKAHPEAKLMHAPLNAAGEYHGSEAYGGMTDVKHTHDDQPREVDIEEANRIAATSPHLLFLDTDSPMNDDRPDWGGGAL